MEQTWFQAGLRTPAGYPHCFPGDFSLCGLGFRAQQRSPRQLAGLRAWVGKKEQVWAGDKSSDSWHLRTFGHRALEDCIGTQWPGSRSPSMPAGSHILHVRLSTLGATAYAMHVISLRTRSLSSTACSPAQVSGEHPKAQRNQSRPSRTSHMVESGSNLGPCDSDQSLNQPQPHTPEF